MKHLAIIYSIFCVCIVQQSVFAQETLNASQDNELPYLERHPVYDYDLEQLSASDSIPDYSSKRQPLKITGTIYQSDGVTPAEGVILYIEQADDNGDFDVREQDGKQYTFHRGWIKTDANGIYTFYTFIPGNDRRYNQLSQLFPTVKEPLKQAYNLESFLFDDDPMLTKLCRKKITKKGDPTRILKPTLKNKILVVEKNIVLSSNIVASK